MHAAAATSLVLLLGLAPPAPGQDDPFAAAVQSAGDEAGRLLDSGAVLGLCAGLLKGGATRVAGYGRIRAGSETVPDGDSVYEIGSITKTFTGVLLADAVERRLAALDDPMQRFLPEGVALGDGPDTGVTLLHLATHTSGLPRLPNNMAPTDPLDPYADYDAARLFAGLGDEFLDHPAGERYAYSNLGVGLLGALVQRMNGAASYEALLVERITAPLAMNSTRVRLDADLRARLAAPYTGGVAAPKNWEFDALAGCGGIRSSVHDLLRYAAANLDPAATPIALALAAAQRRHHTFGDGPGGVALGWHLESDALLWHNGQTGGYHAYLGLCLDQDVAVVVLSSSASDRVDALGRRLLELLRG